MTSSQRRSPYQGLIPYTEADAPYFFGREKEVRLIIANLFASPLTILYGPSGVGKSSVLRAGVAHQLDPRTDIVAVVFNRWQGDPLTELRKLILDKTAYDYKYKSDLTTQPLHKFLSSLAEQFDTRVMVMLDQFEEYFLYHPNGDEFEAELSEAVTQSNSAVSFLLSIREDFYAKLDRFEASIPSLYDNYLRIAHLHREAALGAIQKPIEQYNLDHPKARLIRIESELVEAVLHQVATGKIDIGAAGVGPLDTLSAADDIKEPIETPFLQLVMTRLWDEEALAKSTLLRLATLDRLGGATSIVRNHLDTVMNKLSTKDQNTAANLFRYLVTPSGTKIAYNGSDLAGIAELPVDQVRSVLDKLSAGDVRILRPVDPSPMRPSEPRYEIFHDVLATAVLDWRARRVQAQLNIETLDNILRTFDPTDREIAARILSQLVSKNDTRQTNTLHSLAFIAGLLPDEEVLRVMEQLSQKDLVRSTRREEFTWYELSHDLLIGPTKDWLRARDFQSLSRLTTVKTILLAAYPVVLALVCVYGLFRFWPTGHTNIEPVVFLRMTVSLSEDERLLIIVILAAMLGTLVTTARSLFSYLGVGRRVLLLSWLLYLVLLPLIGAVLALMFYSVIRGGLLNSGITATVINPFGTAALSGLVGMFSQAATSNLREVFGTLFTTTGSQEDFEGPKT